MTKKKKHFNKIKKHFPDEVHDLGPISIARYGNANVIRNNLTPEGHEELNKKLLDSYDEVIGNINNLINDIRSIISSVDPIQLMQRNYFQMLMMDSKIQSEHEMGQDEIISMRMIDYIQSVIAGSNQSENREELTEELYEKLKSKVGDLYSTLGLPYILVDSAYRKANDRNYNLEFDKIYVQALGLWLNVRGNRYSVHEIEHLKDLLNQHDEIFNNLFGIKVENFIHGIEKLFFSLTKGFGIALDNVKNAHKEFLETIKDRSSLTAEEFKKAVDYYSISQSDQKEDLEKAVKRVFSTDLFDVKIITEWPDILLDELSWQTGQEQEFFSEGEFCGWPLRIQPIMLRPFLKIEERHYCFDPTSLMDFIYRVIQKMIIRLNPDYKNAWNDKQKRITEELPFQLFSDILPENQSFKNIYYKSNISGKAQEWAETDGLLIFDDHLIVIEIKAGAFTYTSPANDFPAYIESIKNLLQKPADQSTRFIDYLNSSDKVKIFNKEHEEIGELKKDNFRHITACCISLDSFTTLASQAENLKGIGIGKNKYPIWAISIDDLRIYRDLFTSPYIFLHYLEERNRAYVSEIVNATDELDHIGLYFVFNRYVTQAEDMISNNSVNFLGWDGYRKDIDIYYSNLFREQGVAEKPKQKMQPILDAIIQITSKKIKKGYSKAISTILDFDGEARNNFEIKIKEIIDKQSKVSRPIPMTFFGDPIVTIFCKQNHFEYPDKNWMIEYLYKPIISSNSKVGLGTILEIENEVIKDVDFFEIKRNEIPQDIIDKSLNAIPEFYERMKQNILEQTGKSKIGRNESCPCGSGKKYKKCHGK